MVKLKQLILKQKPVRMYIEPLITKARKGDFNSIRQIFKSLKSKEIVHKLVHVISPNFANRNGGYTRIVKLGYRNNDRASVSYIEFVESDSSNQNEVEKEKE
jgi:ribosomal protein L17